MEGIPLEEDLGYERTVAKLEERWGVALRTYDGRCPAENGQGYTKVTICCLGWCSRHPHHSGQGSVGIREGQLLHIPAKVDLYKVGS